MSKTIPNPAAGTALKSDVQPTKPTQPIITQPQIQNQQKPTTLNERPSPQKTDQSPNPKITPATDQLGPKGTNSMKENNIPQLIVTNDTGGAKKLDKGITPTANNGSPQVISRNQSQKLSGVSQKVNSSMDKAENSQSPGPQQIIDPDDIIKGYEKSNENLVHMIDNVEHLLQTFSTFKLNPSESVEQLDSAQQLGQLGSMTKQSNQARYTHDVLHKIDYLIEKCRTKMLKMEAEHKRLYQILVNSEQKRREYDIKAQIQVNEADLNKLREHYNGLVRYNEGNINAVIKTSQTTKKLLNQMQNYQNEIKLYKHKHLEMMRQVREEESMIKNQHMEMTDLISSQLKMSNEERMIRNNQNVMSKTGNFNKSMTKVPEGSSFTDLSPKSRYDKTLKMIGLVKRHRQFKREQFDHHQKNCQQQVFDNKKKIAELNDKIKTVDAENEGLKEYVDNLYQLTGVIRSQLNQSPQGSIPAIEYNSQSPLPEQLRTLQMPSPGQKIPIKIAPSTTISRPSNKPLIPKGGTTTSMKNLNPRFDKESVTTKMTSSYNSLPRNRNQQSASQLGPSGSNLPPIITTPTLINKSNSNSLGRQQALQISYNSGKNMAKKPSEFVKADEPKSSIIDEKNRNSINVDEIRMQYE